MADSTRCRKPATLPIKSRFSLSHLLRSTSVGRLTVHKRNRYMEPEVIPIGRHDVTPSNLPLSSPPRPPSSPLPPLSQQTTTASCSNLPSASPSSSLQQEAPPGTPPPLPPDEPPLQTSWSAERLEMASRSSSPLTAGRSTDGLLVSGDRESPCHAPAGSTETVDSSVCDKLEDCNSSGHASLSSDDMSRTTSPHTLESGCYSQTDSSRSSSHRSYDSPSHRSFTKQSQSNRPLAQYMKESPPCDYEGKSLYERRNGSFKSKRERERQRERHHSSSGSSSHSDDRLYKKESQPYDSGYQRDSYWQKPGSPRTGSPSTGSPVSGSSPLTGSPRTGPPSVGNGTPKTTSTKPSQHPPPLQLDRNGYPVHVRTASESDADTMPGTLAAMSMGTAVVKVKGPGRCTVKTLYLDSNKTSLRWKPSKKGNKARINIDLIKEVRDGESTDILKRLGPASSQYNPNCCFSIVYGTAWESLDLIADDQEDADMWIIGLRYLMANSKRDQMRMRSNEHRDLWLRATFEAADKSGDGLLSIDEILKLLHKLNVSLSKRKVKQLFKEADSNTNDDNVGQLSYDEFIHFYKQISTREELDSILREYGHGKGYLTLQELARFLSLEQCVQDVEMDHCVDIIRQYEPVPENSKNGWLGIDGFARYLLSREGDICNPKHAQVNQDMSQPLSHYYIASSHNTYLVGDQLMSQSSVDVYAMVLQAGCRCVEMDCWDGKDGEPIIYHGYTLTSRIKFRDVITIVNKYAFVASPYPVILSIENHCSIDQQKKMAQYLVDILGATTDRLEVPTLASVSSHLPSPEQLRGRILIKAKKLPLDHNEELEAGEVSEEDSADELDEDFKLEKRSMSQRFESMAMAQMALMKKKPIKPSQSAWKRIAAKAREQQEDDGSSSQQGGNNGKATSLTGTLRRLKLTKKKKSQSSSESESGEWDKLPEDKDGTSQTGSFDKDEDCQSSKAASQTSGSTSSSRPTSSSTSRAASGSGTASRGGKRIVLSKQLSELVKLTRSVNFRGFINLPCWELPSLGEMRASNMVATKPMEFVAFTTRHMCRVYPSAYRIDSSNYNPQPMWNCGCQLVALNYQTEGKPMQLATALFSGNGSCGYVLKPYPFRDDSKPFDPNSVDPMPGSKKTQVSIHIISGQQLPKPPQSLLGERGEIIDPYVEVEVIGLPIDCAKAQTKTIQDNGFNPCWDCSMAFTIHLFDLALIRFAVWDEDPIGRDFIGQVTMPIRSLIPGYRHIHLEGLDQASLFVHITIEDYDTWAVTKRKPKGTFCRTKPVELEYSPLTGHRNSPRRRSSLAQMFRRKHSMPAMTKDIGAPSSSSPSRMKRRSYDDANSHSSIEEQNLPDDCWSHHETTYPVCVDVILRALLWSGIPTELEADGSVSIHVRYLYHVFITCNLSPSHLLTAIREGAISVWSEEGSNLLTGNYNWDIVQRYQGMKRLGSVDEEDDEEYDDENDEDWNRDDVMISPYSHSNKDSFENGLDAVDIPPLQSETCYCEGACHENGCHLDLVSDTNASNDRTEQIHAGSIHGSFPDIIKSTSLPRDTKQRPHQQSSTDNIKCTIEDNLSTSDDASLNSADSSCTLDLGEDQTECMCTDSDDVFVMSNHESSPSPGRDSPCAVKSVQTNRSYLQNIPNPPVPAPRSPSQSEISLVDISLQTNRSFLQNIPSPPAPAPRVPSTPEVSLIDISQQTNRSFLQNIPIPPVAAARSPSPSNVQPHKPLVRTYAIVSSDKVESQQSLNRNPLGKTDSFSSTSSSATHHSPDGSTMSISSSLCREYDTLLNNFDKDSDVVSLQSQQSTICSSTGDNNSAVLTVNDILSMTTEGKQYHDNDLQEPATSLPSNLNVTLSDIRKDVTSQTLDDAISDISETEYESDFSDTLSTTSGEVSLCNGWQRGDSPNLELMLGSFNRRNSSFSGSQDSDDLTGQTIQPRKPCEDSGMVQSFITTDGHNDVMPPFEVPTMTGKVMRCTCANSGSRGNGGSQRRYRKRKENLRCTCSRKNRLYMQQYDTIGHYQTTDNTVSMYNDNNNNGELVLVDVRKDKDLSVSIHARQNRSPENVLRKVSQRLSSEEFDCRDNVSTTSSDSSASSASTVVEVALNNNKIGDDKLSLLQFEDMFTPDEYDTFKNDLMWRWYNSRDENPSPKSPSATTLKDRHQQDENISDSSGSQAPADLKGQDLWKNNPGLKNGLVITETTEVDIADGVKTLSSIKQPILRQSSVLSNPDDDDVFLPAMEPKVTHLDVQKSSNALDEMIQNLCAIVNSEAEGDPVGAKDKESFLGNAIWTKSNLRKDLNGEQYCCTTDGDHLSKAATLPQQNRERTLSSRSVRFAEVDYSRVAVVRPVMKDTGSLQRSCLKKSATIAGPHTSLKDIRMWDQENTYHHQTPSIVQKFYQRKYGKHQVKKGPTSSHLSRSSPHLASASSKYVPKYTSPPPYGSYKRQLEERMLFNSSNYERSQSVMNISQSGQMGEQTKRCDPAVLLYGTYRPPQRSKKTVTQPPAAPLPRPPSYEQHLQKYGVPRFLQSSKNRNHEIPPSPILAQFSSEKKRCSTQPAVVRRRDKKGMKLEPGGKNRHSTGSYIGMSQQQLDYDLTQDWLEDDKHARGQRSTREGSNDEEHDKQESPTGQKSKLKDRMIYFLLNL